MSSSWSTIIQIYEMKFLVPNYSCLQNSWLGGYCPQIPVLSVLCPQMNLLNRPSPRTKLLGTPLKWSAVICGFKWDTDWFRIVHTHSTKPKRFIFINADEVVNAPLSKTVSETAHKHEKRSYQRVPIWQEQNTHRKNAEERRGEVVFNCRHF